MSNLAIKGAATGTGTFTLESPATNTDRVLVLPDEAGTILTTAGVPASAMPAGSVVQHVNSSLAGSSAQTTVNTFFDTGLSITVTPKLSSSKLVVFFTQGVGLQKGTGDGARVDWDLYCTNDSYSLANNVFIGAEGLNTAGTVRIQLTGSGTYINTSTVAKTFRIQLRKAGGNNAECGTIYYLWYAGGQHTMQVLEVAV